MILLIDLCDEKESLSQDEFVMPIAEIIRDTGKEYRIIHYPDVDEHELDAADRVILCGTSLKDLKYIENIHEFHWILDYNKPILGICAGMQVISLIFGGELIDATQIGMHKITLLDPNIDPDSREEIEVYELHNKSCTLPNNFAPLAENSTIQAFKHNEKNIIGLLFHPEVNNKEMIRAFL